MRLSLLTIVAAAALIASIPAAETKKATEADTLFDEFCGPATDTTPLLVMGSFRAIDMPVCQLDRTLVPQGVKWLVLDEHCACTNQKAQVCSKFKELKAASTTPHALLRDHESDRWRLLFGPSDADKSMKRAIDGVPTVSLSRESQLLVGVERSNPLLYAVTPVSAKEEDIGGFPDLQKLVGMIGGLAESVLDIAGVTHEAIGPVASGTVQEFRVLLKEDPSLLGLGTAADPKIVDPAKVVVVELTMQVQRIRRVVQAAQAQKADAIGCINDVELRHDHEISTTISESCQHSRYQDLRTEVDDSFGLLTKGLVECLAPVEAALARLPRNTRLEGPGADVVTSIVSQSTGHPCTAAYPLTMNALADAIDPNRPEAAIATVRSTFTALREAAETSGPDDITATSLLNERGVIDTAAAMLVLFKKRLLASLIPAEGEGEGTACMTRRIHLDDPTAQVKWNKIHIYEAEIVTDSPFEEDVAASRASGTTLTYKTAWHRRGAFGVGAALTYTGLAEPSWSVVDVSGDPNAPDLRIQETDEEARAGQVALFLNYRFMQHALGEAGRKWFYPGIDIGVGLDVDDAALFTGIGFDLSKYLRVGGGRTFQKVKELDGQVEGEMVDDKDAITTRDDFDSDWYLSLSLVIESLKFWGGDNDK